MSTQYEELSDEEVTERRNYAYISAHPCNRIIILSLDEDELHQAQDCPRCGKRLTWVNTQKRDDLDAYPTCVQRTCSQYLSTVAATDNKGRCEGTRTDKKGPCNEPPVQLDDLAIQELLDDSVAPEENSDPAPVRQLKALMWKVDRWVHGPGAHHRTGGGGARGAATTARHQEAHQATMQVRNRYGDDLDELAEQVSKLKDPDNKLIGEAKALANAARQK